MNHTTITGLAECITPLDEDGRCAVRRYWEQVIQEEWGPPVRQVPRAVPPAEDGRRERRQARRSAGYGVGTTGIDMQVTYMDRHDVDQAQVRA